ncbi:hypothetical protein CRE_29838 [Caenorhabditis remanei]|uniref:Palmitoyltransferase n=1 Tax=Caenorhabditis remanei TaxID=31234 RepID=E3LW10_CAERE|nr:hypothetical protein CRE_29838 [Caenorhabditis remanei]
MRKGEYIQRDRKEKIRERNVETRGKVLGILRFGSKIVGNDDSIINESSLMKVLDKLCITLAVAKTTWIVFFFFTVQLPFDYERLDFFPFTLLRVLCGLWLTYSVPYHYLKARTAEPIQLPKRTPTGPNCSFCTSSKPRLTSHCRTCDTCVYRRDHHCPWMGQCIGIHNQANFFLFLFSVFLSTIFVLYVEYEFWMENVKIWIDKSASSTQWNSKVAGFSLSIIISLHLIMLSFVITYVFLVSGGFALLDMLFQKEGAQKLTLSKIHLRWRQYLAVRRDDSILRALFIPSDRVVRDFDFI